MTNSEAIAVLMEHKRYVHENSVPDQALDMGIKALKNERKKGKWIITDIDIINRVWHCNCSECGEDPLHFISGTEDWWLNKLPDYCPSCGAEMSEGNINDQTT